MQEIIAYVQLHPELMQNTLSPASIAFAQHARAHSQQMHAKAAAQQMQMMAAQAQHGGAPGAPPSPGPRPGAQVAGPRGAAQQPAGRIHPDAMKGGVVQMPRRMG
jgi:hypothetical protein